MKNKFKILLTTGILIVGLIAITVLAAPPNKCSPWPDCKNGGEDPQPPECPNTNIGVATPSLVLSTSNSMSIYQWDGSDYVEVTRLTGLNMGSVRSMAIGDVMSCHPGSEIIISGGSYSGKSRKKTHPYVKVFAYDGTTITEIESITPGISPWGIATGRLYSSDVDQLLVDSASSKGEGTQHTELYEHDGSSFVKVHDFVKDPLSTGNFWTFIADFTGSGTPVAGIQKGNLDTPKRGFWLWENQAGSWVNIANIAAGEFVHDDGELVDVDNDTIPDLITTGSDGDLVVVKGGSYEILLNYNISAGVTQSLAVGDFNGDDCKDIVVGTEGIGSDAETYTAAVFEGDCNGNFTRVNNLNSDHDDSPVRIQVMESMDLNENDYDEIFLYQNYQNSGNSILDIWEYNGLDYVLVDSKIVASGEGAYTAFGSAMLP